MQERVSSLYRLAEFPFDPDHEMFAEYSALKMGVRRGVEHYAELMEALIRETVASDPSHRDWILTSPPRLAMPSAANLLAWRVAELLSRQLPDGITVTQLDIPRTPDPESFIAVDYAQQGESRRVAIQERSLLTFEKVETFRDRPVMFLNDINVTGSHQRLMQRYFAAVEPALLHWLYVIDVDPSVGRSIPQLEASINGTRLSTFEDFVSLLANEELEPTSKCLYRLFRCDLDQVEKVAVAISADRRARILDLAEREDFYSIEYFKQKIDILRAAANAS